MQLSYDRGGGAESARPLIFIYENNRKINKIMHCVEEKKNLSASFEDMAIFHVNLEIDSFEPKIREKCP